MKNFLKKRVSDGRHGEGEYEWSLLRIITFTVILFFMASLLLSAPVSVPAGYKGVVLTWGKVTGTMDPGLNFKIPIAQDVVLMDIRVLKAERNGESAGTKDLQEVTVDLTLNYQVNPSVADKIYSTIGKSYQVLVVEPNMDEALKAVTAKFTAEEIITRRDTVKSQLKEELQDRLNQYSISVLSVSFTDFQFSKVFTDAIEAKVTAIQRALEAQNELVKIQFEQQQKIITANAEANATVTKATADGRAVVISAEAQAQAIKLIQQQIASNPEYLRYIYIMKWDGQLPTFMGSGVIPFFDLNATESN